jgi:signal transduction histidine kinase
MKQALINVLKNALEATTEGSITAEASSSGDQLTIRVIDTGAGISEDDLEHVFDLFYTTKEEGTGLGLSIVRQILEDHGGSVEIESSPGRGTQCTLILPLPHSDRNHTA